MSFKIMSGAVCVATSETLEAAKNLLESGFGDALKAECANGLPPLVTFRILGEFNQLLAVRTNRQIMAKCTLQQWVGIRNDSLTQIGEPVEFDATNDVLAKDYDWFSNIKDNNDSSDFLIYGNVEHDGPFEIEVEDSICDFFGVGHISEITQAAFEDAKAWFKPKGPVTKTLTLTVSVRVRVNNEDVDLDEVSSELDYQFKSTVPGACVVDSEIIEEEWA